MAGRVPDRRVVVDHDAGCWRGRFQAMASPCEVLVDCDSRDEAHRATSLAAREAWRIEDKFSRYIAGNPIDRINTADGQAVEVDDEIAAMLDFADTLTRVSDGKFDITSGVLREIWRFDGGNDMPSDDAIAGILERIGWDRVEWRRPVLRMRPGMQIDFGGIGKEYAVDRAAAILRDTSEFAALVNFGGDLATTHRRARKAAWRVGIESVTAAGQAAEKIIQLSTGAIATSGDARRYVVHKGIRYGHILDPRTGRPVSGAPRSVTVAADTCTQAGMLSTLAMLEGKGAEDFLERENVRFWCWR